MTAQGFIGPSFSCLVVQSPGVTVNWNPIQDPDGVFQEMELFRYNPQTGVSTSLLVTSDPTLTDFLHTPTLAATDSVMYYLLTTITEGGSTVQLSTDTMATIDLGLQNLVNKAILTWNEPLADDTTNAFTHYEIQHDYGMGWLRLDSLPRGTQRYDDTIMVCQGLDPSVEIDYRVLLHHESGCVSVSNIRTGDFQDLNAPAPPVIETVTVDTATNLARICWFPNTDGDIGSYLVLQYFSPMAQVTLPGQVDHPDTEYINFASQAEMESEGYLVVAQDTCIHLPPMGTVPQPNRSGFEIQSVHFTMFLETRFLTCDRAVLLEWSPYFGWPEDGTASHVIHMREGNGAWQVLDTISPGAVEYMHQGVEVMTDYSYSVEVISASGRKSSFSNRSDLFTEYPDIPSSSILANVSVLDDDRIELKTYVIPAAEGTSYRFERLDRFGEEFDPLFANFQGAVDADGFITRVDAMEVRADEQIYTYQVTAVDSCGFDVATSAPSSNMLLRVRPEFSTRTNVLTWSVYNTWQGNISRYEVYRARDGAFNDTPYAVLPGSQNFFQDVVADISDYEDGFRYCYRVEAVEAGNPFGFDQRSASNVVCVEQEPVFYLPNAIVVGGVNGEFRPQGGYLDRTRYQMEIFNRWSQLIFSTQDFDEAWDGTVSGNRVPEGIYLYQVRFFTDGGQEFQYTGHITVLHADN